MRSIVDARGRCATPLPSFSLKALQDRLGNRLAHDLVSPVVEMTACVHVDRVLDPGEDPGQIPVVDAQFFERSPFANEQGISFHHAFPIRMIGPEARIAFLPSHLLCPGNILIRLEEVIVEDIVRPANFIQLNGGASPYPRQLSKDIVVF